MGITTKAQPGVRRVRYLIPALIRLLDQWQPDVLLLPESEAIGVRGRSRHVCETIRAVKHEAIKRGILVHIVTYDDVRTALADTDGERLRNRGEITKKIVEEFPELAAFLQPPRSDVNDSELYFTPLFFSVAMYLAWRSRS